MDLDRAVDEIIERLRNDGSLIGDAEANRRLLAHYPGHEPQEIARRAREVWREEVRQGDIARALGATFVAGAVYLAIGDETLSMRATYDGLQLLFMVADDVDAYRKVRRRLLELFVRARERGSAELAFEIMAKAAECSYFAADGVADEAQVEAALDTLVADLLMACEALRRCPDCRRDSPAVFELFVSVVAAAYQKVEQSRGWLLDAQRREALRPSLRLLAAAVEDLVPDDFVFELQGEPHKSAQVAGGLARLSAEHGNKDKASARLRRSLLDE